MAPDRAKQSEQRGLDEYLRGTSSVLLLSSRTSPLALHGTPVVDIDRPSTSNAFNASVFLKLLHVNALNMAHTVQGAGVRFAT